MTKKMPPTFDNAIEFERSTATKTVLILIDTSASMEANGKIQAANSAVRSAGIALSDLQSANQQKLILIRRLTFNSIAEWADAKAVPVSDFQPNDLTTGGGTNTVDAIRLCASYLQTLAAANTHNAGIILVSDGHPDAPNDYNDALQEALQLKPFAKADRIAIAIGDDADKDSLSRFISPGFPLYNAKNANQLVEQLKLASVILATGVRPDGITAGEDATDPFEPSPVICESIVW